LTCGWPGKTGGSVNSTVRMVEDAGSMLYCGC
jgi:hypothetical protein